MQTTKVCELSVVEEQTDLTLRLTQSTKLRRVSSVVVLHQPGMLEHSPLSLDGSAAPAALSQEPAISPQRTQAALC